MLGYVYWMYGIDTTSILITLKINMVRTQDYYLLTLVV